MHLQKAATESELISVLLKGVTYTDAYCTSPYHTEKEIQKRKDATMSWEKQNKKLNYCKQTTWRWQDGRAATRNEGLKRLATCKTKLEATQGYRIFDKPHSE